LKKVKTFCSDIHDPVKYPNALKTLSGISEETRDILLKEIRKYQKKVDRSSSGYVETELMRRFLRQSYMSQPTVKKIEGPISVFQMSSDKHPHIFYMFGDRHVKLGKCGNITTFTQWIKDTIINSLVFIDVYVEKPYKYKKYITTELNYSRQCYLTDFRDQFRSCFFKLNTKIQCQTARFHYTDIRRITETLYQYYGRKSVTLYDWNRRIPETNAYIEFVTSPYSIIKTRIRKQFNAIKEKPTRILIENEFKICLYEHGKNIRNIVSGMDYNTIYKILRAVKMYNICLMDYYLIARCFRTYDKKEGYSRPSYNNIIYAGAQHIRNYVKILNKLGFKIDAMADQRNMYEKMPAKMQCLDISKIKQPLFHQRYA